MSHPNAPWIQDRRQNVLDKYTEYPLSRFTVGQLADLMLLVQPLDYDSPAYHYDIVESAIERLYNINFSQEPT